MGEEKKAAVRPHPSNYRGWRGGWGPGPGWGPRYGPYGPYYRRPWEPSLGEVVGSALGTVISNAVSRPPRPATVIVKKTTSDDEPPPEEGSPKPASDPSIDLSDAMKVVAAGAEGTTITLTSSQYHTLVEKSLVDYDADKNPSIMKRKIVVA